jgi:putative tricarboxylic transport membrane protein
LLRLFVFDHRFIERDLEMNLLQVLVASAVSGMLLLASPGDALAQAKYPSKSIEVVVPFAPGGGTDNLMRMITGIMDENKWSPVPLNVNNRPGGSGTIGFSYLISKKGDAHVVAGATPMIVSGKLQGRLPGNHRDAITVLMIVAIDELMLSVRTESPFKTIEDFVNAARAKPDQLTVGGTGTHNEDHIFAHLFEQAAKIKLKYVPFNSGGEVTAALLGGHIDAGIMNPNEISAQVEAGKAKNLAVASRKRMTGAPDLPTFAEKGYTFYWEQMRGVVGPGNMPPEAVAWWQDTLKKVTMTKKWQDEYIKGNLLTPTAWVGEEANTYLDGITGDYERALGALGGLKK